MSSPTIKEVAARSGVGIGTVSRVLNHSPQISEETRVKVLKAIEELNYVPKNYEKWYISDIKSKRLEINKKVSNTLKSRNPNINHTIKFCKLCNKQISFKNKSGYF